ncbi:MAG: hypothetical protein ACOCR0_00320 [Haloferacaceae archaeon]
MSASISSHRSPLAEPAPNAITSAAGYNGSRVVGLLTEQHPDWEYVALENFDLEEVRRIGDVVVRHVDARNRNTLGGAPAGTDVVLHLAAISGVDDVARAYVHTSSGSSNGWRSARPVSKSTRSRPKKTRESGESRNSFGRWRPRNSDGRSPIEVVENPRRAQETLVETFAVGIS